ncbi:uncharacterized protein PgNI_00887 [Pyricularia grisea]|uniref:Uncharacterized protein n=1 Tax=Pyricularia grisea TaxID=148305 RepID=A0A6P8BND5_PYRGI|nr:uncharacterized protein PgNI_00887 [Pyricularia grisea]TLD17887.1 hypothetical protein PgNI_00887 [Pyricularia grisea]
MSRDIIDGHALYLFQFGPMPTSSHRNLWINPLSLPTLQFNITSAQQHMRALLILIRLCQI